ncbi:hypothetical protein CLV35_2085 [Motilibacter peucedani]|uniref:Uncharacterized protein n=1 Tax=Motilibacter peucedani TaxID=598650 RepID=A0A420XQM5_9ACTN|nr:hypothetical protein [Motilibacter peucedani]RKS75611.1 hypothetical protein CLV35_2085 [Motilibacter peucedani]
MTSTPLHRETPPHLTLSARARALELIGAYIAEVGQEERRATLDRVAAEVVDEPAAVRVLVHALTEYAATFADVAATATSTPQHVVSPATLVQALARMDLAIG